MRIDLIGVLVVTAALTGCGGGTPPGSPPSKAVAIKKDVQQLGHDVAAAGKEVGSEALDKAKELKDKAIPAIQAAGTKVQDGIHDVAQKVADKTATQPQ